MTLSVIDTPDFLDLPASPPPPGVTPNFENPSNLSAPGLAVLQLTLATLVVAMRLYTKRVVVKRMLVEDWWILAAYICFAGFHANVFLIEKLPLGVHLWDLKVRDVIRHGKIFHISTAIYSLVALPLKVAIILQIRRIVLPTYHSDDEPSHVRTALRWVIDSFIAINVAFYLALFLFQFFTCTPLRKAWDFRVPGTCVAHRLIVHIASASINTASDLITIILPQPVIWKLELERRRKWGLSAVFLLGALACAASACRLYYTVRLFYTNDSTYVAGQMGKLVEPELTFGFLAVCFPVLPAFIKHIRRSTPFLKVRDLWTSSPPSDMEQSSRRDVDPFGSGRIKKVVQVDLDPAELTRIETGEGNWGGRKELVEFRYEEWHNDDDDVGDRTQISRPTQVLRWV